MRVPVVLIATVLLAGCHRPDLVPWTLVHGDVVEGSCPGGFALASRPMPLAERRRWAPADALAPAAIPDAWSSARATRRKYTTTSIIGVLPGEHMWWFALDVESHFPHSRPRHYLGLVALDASGLRTEVGMLEVDDAIDLRWAIVDRELYGSYVGERGRAKELRALCRPLFDPAGLEWDAGPIESPRRPAP